MPSKYGHTDARTDIYQLGGVMFYELLTGELPPFEATPTRKSSER